MDALVGTTREPQGPEWFSTDDYMERYAVSRQAASRSLKRLMAEGKIERWEGNISSIGRYGYKYRLKP